MNPTLAQIPPSHRLSKPARQTEREKQRKIAKCWKEIRHPQQHRDNPEIIKVQVQNVVLMMQMAMELQRQKMEAKQEYDRERERERRRESN